MIGSDPRKSALSILNALDQGHSTLDRLISERFDPVEPQALSRRDQNLAYALIYGVLRWRGRLDWIIHQFTRDPVERIDPQVLNILRIGLFQIFHLDRVPDSAAVNTSVELAKRSAAPWVVRFVNGLLRNAIRNRSRIQWPDETSDPLLWLSVDQSFPLWLTRRWADRFGFEETLALCRFLNSIPPLTLRTNTLKITRDHLAESLRPVAETVAATPVIPEGISLYGIDRVVNELPGFSDGHFQVQDEAAQLVAHVMAPEPGETILDACAGLGGKTGHIAQMIDNRGHIFALDKEIRKLDALNGEMSRLGVTIVTTRPHDLDRGFASGEFPLFDRVLLDAPCSGIGVIRRNPDTKWSSNPADFSRLAAVQERFLDHAAYLVRPGGLLVYAVCSIAPEETGDVVSAFLKAHPEFSMDTPPKFRRQFATLIDNQGCFRSMPHVHKMDGFFIARLKKSAAV